MKKVKYVFLIAVIISLAGDPLLLAEPENAKAPDFTLDSLRGETYTLSGLQGKVVLVNFWSSTCKPCLLEMPSFNKLYKKMEDKPFEILAVTADPRSMAENAVEDRDLDLLFPVLLDPEGKTAQKYEAYNMPTTYIIAPDGTIDNKVLGAANWADDSVIEYINELIEENKKQKDKEEDKNSGQGK
ncbi:MAG: TlpA disulfide reductase family protein [bacterium]